ncbi:MAG: glycoside hydrolase family 20 zincin-like fold domain-containing protein [Clostridium sp.]|uniref:glycoside hydrolase family 20 zincin-like fold domain-containing protein n=1 Tax=Clostridium sp. DSM 8431 TaxID=1761781 RepID=UPI0008F3B21C|nr:glycoside hydrolase family 20 zincin-like fold domain-containing protein [Clostridium sp. DSM 8431]MCR4944704.1 glycoside hydrolase family 20 zincin-like fold domain-containing protein [Clostridium sp.]SFU72825.1 Glycosyl hydrolase family 20, domain 2 [Clostridium sp. DSM 8431]
MKKKCKVLFWILLLTLSMFTEVKAATYKTRNGDFKFTNDTEIYFQGRNDIESNEILNICTYMKMKVMLPTGYDFKLIKGGIPKENSIVLTTINSDESLGLEGYILDIDINMIKLIGYTPEGIFRGVQTLIQMLPVEIESRKVVNNIEWTVPAALINDRPKNDYRGVVIDVKKIFDV